jgi:RNA-directed DNA polymerase
MGDTSRSPTVSTKLQRIAEQAKDYPDTVFTTLAHPIDVDLLWIAFERTRKDAAAGVDGVTAQEYAANLADNLRDLHARLKSGQYQAVPVKRVWLDKEDGRKRPIGIPVLEDKIVQRAVVMLLEAVYEQDFYDFSHAFRAGHSPHQALHELRERCMELNINWIVEADISGFFDSIEHALLLEVIRQRVNDGGILRLIGKWLNAGVLEGETLTYSEQGTPQGGVISPMLANIFLHHVLDEWCVKEVQPRMKGRVVLVRFADDFVIGCELESDARRIMEVLPKRCARFQLTIHPDKTALIPFQRPKANEAQAARRGTFDFLGFTHYWAKSRRGYWVIKRKTARKRLRRFVKGVWQWCRQNRHLPLKEQFKQLSLKLRGHFQYYGIRGNYAMLERVYYWVECAWRYWLNRRGNKQPLKEDKYSRLKQKYPLPRPAIIHNI